MISRANQYARVPTNFRGGPPPRIPDSLFRPLRPTIRNLTYLVNTRFGIGPDLHRYIPRTVPVNIQNGQLVISQPLSRQTTASPQYITIRNGSPVLASFLVQPISNG
jgi:hypothetical protein